jgi:signal transduction histidine kinase
MTGLLFVQIRIVKDNAAMYKQQFYLTVPEYLGPLQELIRNDAELVTAVNLYQGKEKFLIQSFEKAPDNQIFFRLKNKFDSLFKRNNLSIEYEIKGLIESNHRCHFYEEEEIIESNESLKEVVKADHFICLCGPDVGESHGSHGDGDYTAFDISINYPNQMGNFIGDNIPLLRNTILLLLVLIFSFSYTIINLNKQKKLSQMKNDFINNLTHEFKTPIFSISLASGLLRKSKEVQGNEKLTKYTELIDVEGKRLKSQVDKVLQMALIDSGNFRLEKKEIDLHSLIFKVAKSFELIINERGGELKLNLKAKKFIIYADETHLNNIIYNLLDNAQKYTDRNPEIIITTTDDTEGVVLKVADYGIGMGKDAQRYIFDKFYRAEAGNVQSVKGFGLGLSYVKSVVEAHKGKISLKSQKNIGSEFKIYLPTKA